MQTDRIIHEVEIIVQKTGSRDPYRICEEKDISLHLMDLKRRIKAYYFYHSRIHNIVIDENTNEIFRPVLIAHELGHVTLHQKLAMIYGFQELEVLEKRNQQPMEYEANLFAAELLLKDSDVLEALNTYTFFETASLLHVPAALLDFKFTLLQHKGYRMHPLSIHRSDFLKNDAGAYLSEKETGNVHL